MSHKKIKFAAVCGFLFICLWGVALSSQIALAADYINFQPQISIPGTEFDSAGKIMVEKDTSYIAKYIKTFYDYGLGIAGILAAIVLMGGGVIWLTSGGSETRVSQAKELIFGSIIGLVLLSGAWIILNTINPELVSFKPTSITAIKEIAIKTISCDKITKEAICNSTAFCAWKDNKCMGKVAAGEAKCSTNKAEVPGPIQCCCQSNPSGYVNCKWATFMGDAYLKDADNPRGAPTAGPCAACGSTEYGVVASGKEYLCQKAYEDELAAKNNTSTLFSLTGCENKKEESSCTKLATLENGTSFTTEGFCKDGTCHDCNQPGTTCEGAFSSNYTCATKKDGQCGTEHHGNCKLKLNQSNFCEATIVE